MRKALACRAAFPCVLILPLLACGLAHAGDDAESLHLARNGKTNYVIVQGKSATESEAFAVTELRDYLKKATGARWPVVEESKRAFGARGIYVGWTEFAIKHGIDPSKLGREEWVLETIGQDLVLTGGRPVGSLYAVYEFLETNVGCRWLDRDTEIVPRRIDLAVSMLKIRSKPAFWYRLITTGLPSVIRVDPPAPSSEWLVKEGLFLSRNKATFWPTKFGAVGYGSPGGCHTFYAYSKDFPADHPEYFSMGSDGKRERAESGSGPGQLCLTNPEVRKLLLAQLKKFIAKDRENAAKTGQPTPRVYDISQNDNHDHMCLCPTCKALVEKEGSASGLLLDCINELADGIKDEYPDVVVMTFAYTMTLKPPKTVTPRDNVMIRLAQLNGEWAPKSKEALHYPDYFRPLSHPINRDVYGDIVAWSKRAKHLAIWTYWVIYLRNEWGYPTTDVFPTPYVNAACIQPNLQLYLRNRVEDVDIECEHSERSSFQALKLWLGQKLLQDPDQPAAPLVRSFMEGYYGSASPQMTEYLNYMEKRIAAVPATINLSSTSEHLRPYLDLEFFTTVHGLLTEAERKCGADANSLSHVRQEWFPVDAAIFGMWSQLERQLPKGRAMPFDHDALLRQYVDSRSAVLERYYYGKIPAAMQKAIEKEVSVLRALPGAKRASVK